MISIFKSEKFMNKFISNKILLFVLFSIIPSVNLLQAQEFRIHNRGMLHETVFNTGEIGRGWVQGGLGDKTNVPLMEWPSNSKTIVNGISYDGQHNIIGAGVYLGANFYGQSGRDKRVYSFCGAVGSGNGAEVSYNKWSFPISINRTENYPVLADGTLNPTYNPDEAEEIITAKWASSLGVTITRTSRAWSFPDYDDMIIYEYEFVYNGDTDGKPATIEQTAQLRDFMVCFNYGFGPSMYGYQRNYQTWKYTGGMYEGDQNTFWDSDYWLAYNMDNKTGTNLFAAGKPDPDKTLFRKFSQTGENGGGMCSPQAPGYAMLYYPLNHLAIVDPVDTSRNESDYAKLLVSATARANEIDANGHIKQPYHNKITTGVVSSSKIIAGAHLNPYDGRWSGTIGANDAGPAAVNPLFDITQWTGRGNFNKGQTAQACAKLFVTGPYTLHIGDTLRYAYAEVCGYGAQAKKWIQGGQSTTQWFQNPSSDKKVVIDGETLTEHYLTDFGYPDYVNSKRDSLGIPSVANVQQVAHKAATAYLGHEPTLPIWPESNPATGSYKIPVPCPAPGIKIFNTPTADIKLEWNGNVEKFVHPRLMGKLTNYKIYKSKAAMGPWQLISTVPAGPIGNDNSYQYLDTATDFKVGESRYYSITSVDDKGNESGKTNMTQFAKLVAAVGKMGKVYVVPNPFVSDSHYAGQQPNQIGFFGLPAKCTIRIFTYAGQLVETIEHNANSYSETEWVQISKNRQEIASGLYLFVVTTPEGDLSKGKFVVIK